MSAVLFEVARHLEGSRSMAELAEAASAALGRDLDEGDVRFLVDQKLRPAGLIAEADGAAPTLRRADPMLGLQFRARVVPAAAVEAVTTVSWPLFVAPVVVGALAALTAFDGWLLFVHGIAQGVRQVLLRPELSLLVLALIVLSTAAHEVGHATACRYGGARPGPIGVGLYLAWPVFYSDVTDSYRLSRAGRLRTDLGGVYFNLLFALACGGAYLVTHFEPLLVVVVLEHLEVLHQFFPFVRLDGYYVASDLIGVPDLFQRIRPTLSSLVPGRPLHPRVAELKPWARWAVAAWVLLTLAILTALYVLLIFGLPRMLATARLSFATQAAEIATGWRAGRPAPIALGILQEVLLMLPLAALALTAARMVRYLGRLAWSAGESRPALRMAAGLLAAAAIGFAAGTLWQGARYRPIQPWERGTLPAAPAIAAQPTPEAVPAGVPSHSATIAPAPAPRTSSAAPAPPSATAAPAPSPTFAAPSPSAAPSPAPSTAPSSAPSTAPAPSPSPT